MAVGGSAPLTPYHRSASLCETPPSLVRAMIAEHNTLHSIRAHLARVLTGVECSVVTDHTSEGRFWLLPVVLKCLSYVLCVSDCGIEMIKTDNIRIRNACITNKRYNYFFS